MPRKPPTFKPSWAPDNSDRRKQYDKDRGTAAKRGYGSKWQKARAAFLKQSPLCRSCENEGRVSIAKVVDHIIPHKGDKKLFWDQDNWQPLCQYHHNLKTATEDSGFSQRKPRT